MKAFLFFQKGNFDDEQGMLAMKPECVVVASNEWEAARAVGGWYYYEKGELRNVVVFPKKLFTPVQTPIKEDIDIFRKMFEYKKGSLHITISGNAKEYILHIMELPFFETLRETIDIKCKG
jgi:hypothetical protein